MDFDKKKYKVYTWKNWLVLHWILNPGLAVNELILGQRVPKVSLEDLSLDKPRVERSFVPCPHCNTLHDGRTWSTQNGTAFKNWFGLYCNNCGNTIPCLRNALSLIILALTFPIWYGFKDRWKANWLAKQPQRFKNIDLDHIPNAFDDDNWISTGLSWGAFMFLIMSLVFPYFSGEEINTFTLLVGLFTYTFGGLCYGYTMKLFMNKKVDKQNGNTIV